MPKLAYNSMISWANGWYFLIASEIIVMGQINYRLPGLGSYLGQTMSSGDYTHAIFGVLALTAIIVFFHLVVWGPLNDWSVRFLYDTADTPAPVIRGRSRFRFTWRAREYCTFCGRLLPADYPFDGVSGQSDSGAPTHAARQRHSFDSDRRQRVFLCARDVGLCVAPSHAIA
jgi:ABC-type anion transport system duplicated permease subunit